MTDPLAEIVMLLQPSPGVSKTVGGAGRWRLARPADGQPFYGVILEGGCRLAVEGDAPVALETGDFVLIPAARAFAMTSREPPAHGVIDDPPVQLAYGETRLGTPDGLPDVRMLVGHCTFGSPDAGILVALLPQLVHVRGDPRLAAIVGLVRDESRAERPARGVVLARLLEVLLIEALRSNTGVNAAPGLVRGLGDPRLAAAIRRMHERPEHGWTIAELSDAAAMSRSTFFARFERAVGSAPMTYLLTWRMALAQDLLRRGEGVGAVAARVGYASASTFSTAFTRQVGLPPSRHAQERSRQLANGHDAAR